MLLLDYGLDGAGDFQLQSLTHGLITLEHLAPGYGGQRRRLRIQKVRGVAFREGYHDFAIQRGGIVVYPRLVAADHRQEGVGEALTDFQGVLGGDLTYLGGRKPLLEDRSGSSHD